MYNRVAPVIFRETPEYVNDNTVHEPITDENRAQIMEDMHEYRRYLRSRDYNQLQQNEIIEIAMFDDYWYCIWYILRYILQMYSIQIQEVYYAGINRSITDHKWDDWG